MIAAGFAQDYAEFADARPSTDRVRHQAVEHVICTIRKRLDEPLSLPDLANLAWLSPYHFNRVFRQITGVPPFHFLSALRMDAAKRLLLTSNLSVTEVCFEVGYQSLGSFTTHFTRFVGLSPSRFRALPLENIHRAMELLHARPYGLAAPQQLTPLSPGVRGVVNLPETFCGPILIGLFPAAIPQQRPVACCLLTEPGAYHIPHVADGEYFVFAAALEWSHDPLSYLLHSEQNLRVGGMRRPLRVTNGRGDNVADLVLRPLQLIDPPILIALPFLLAECCAHVDQHDAAPYRRLVDMLA
jgi:AraC-like DNA-binding protein